MISHVLPITCIATDHIKDRNDIVALLKFFIHVLGIKDFNPSAQPSFADFLKPDGKPCFDAYQVRHGDRVIERMREVCEKSGEDLDAIACEVSPICNPIKVLITLREDDVLSVESNTEGIIYMVDSTENGAYLKLEHGASLGNI